MTPDGHLDEELSALLDGALSAPELDPVQAHLASCGSCRSELEAERSVRDLVRGLPPIEPPFGFYERLLRDGPTALKPAAERTTARPKRRIKFGVANLVATAAVWLVILGVANVHSGHGSVTPSVNDYVTAHASVLPGIGFRHAPAGEQAAKSYNVPDRLAGSYQLVGVLTDGDSPQLVYSDGSRTLSMFLRPGQLDVSALPSSAQAVSVNGAPAWDVPTDGGDVVFVQRPGMVVVIVGPAPGQAASDVANGPEPSTGSPSLSDRIEAAGKGLLETFGLRG